MNSHNENAQKIKSCIIRLANMSNYKLGRYESSPSCDFFIPTQNGCSYLTRDFFEEITDIIRGNSLCDEFYYVDSFEECSDESSRRLLEYLQLSLFNALQYALDMPFNSPLDYRMIDNVSPDDQSYFSEEWNNLLWDEAREAAKMLSLTTTLSSRDEIELILKYFKASEVFSCFNPVEELNRWLLAQMGVTEIILS